MTCFALLPLPYDAARVLLIKGAVMVRASRLVGVVLAVWLVAACGGSSPAPVPSPIPPPSVNHVPVIASVDVSPAFGVTDLQEFSFRVAASDPDGDTLSYRWSFTYDAAVTDTRASFVGTFVGGAGATVPITVTVSDSKGASVSGSASVVVGSMNGGWTLQQGGALAGSLFQLSQSDSGTVTGEYGIPGASGTDFMTADHPGHVTAAGAVALPVKTGSQFVTLIGNMDPTTGRRIVGTVNGVPFVLVKD